MEKHLHELESPTSKALVSDYGAQVAQWTPNSTETSVLWTSNLADFSPSAPIRGGIPVMFPWFNAGRFPGLAPKHGFARFAHWNFEGESSDSTSTTATWTLKSADLEGLNGPEHFPYQFEARYEVTVGEDLNVRFHVENLTDEEFSFELALHTYFRIGDIENVQVEGVDGLDACNPFLSPEHFSQEGPLVNPVGIDRVFYESKPVEIVDPVLNRRVRISATNASNMIVWNPAETGAAGIPDMEDQEYRQMICVEAGRIYDQAVNLAPGESFELAYRVQCLPL
ncbi:hypothetical protein BSR28_07495 [Boudabousia liubingyangii]|uniref:D-hexose-6-phosphate mutarotase n=1 Tax=Boudabousia liubingyangii TaxID=1921764 RepID=UPI00093EEE65|nr:D-hexose-6-phosphate mutarotase [Boudabousia liubingyangii]OKL46365.1 hypothetical protein BSR28_07495 [Boudabousia liubingyangii]